MLMNSLFDYDIISQVNELVRRGCRGEYLELRGEVVIGG
jgi:hypothetical protein